MAATQICPAFNAGPISLSASYGSVKINEMGCI
jgi:hypothetical protein